MTINLNGTFYSSGKIISSGNRSFLYGDGLFETIRAQELKIPLWSLHYARMIKAAAELGLDVPPWWTQDYFYFELIKTLKENRIQSGKIRLTVYREEGGTYAPNSDRPAYLIQVWPMEGAAFMNEKGLLFGVCDQYPTTYSRLSAFKTTSALPYVLAARKAKKEKWDLTILTDTAGNLSETHTGNLILIRDEKVLTPPVECGCIDGVMKAALLPLLESNGLSVDIRAIHLEELDLADEIWSINALHGIQWAKKCNLREYKNDLALKAQDMLIQNLNTHVEKTT